MNHHNRNRKFGREAGQRRALLRSLATSLILRGNITTTTAKAKELRPIVERLVTKSKKDTLAARRNVIAFLGNAEKPGKKLFTDIAPRYKTRAGGYLRIVKLAPRKGDGSPRARIEFVV